LLGSAASFARHPVEQVGWGDCTRVLGRLGLTLPTEAQWEFACRAGTGTPWCCDEKQLVEHANLADELLRNWGGPPTFAYETWNDGHAIHSPVGTYRPNAFGLHDMHGNVGEWCRDALAEYRVEPREGDGLRIGPPTRQHIVRGGGWYFSAFFARSSLRVAYSVNLADYFLGVRPARSID
jgi:formylglycine-generating enzyme required for sulfatase activity